MEGINVDGLHRFETVCEAFLAAGPEKREKALKLLTEKERRDFFEGVALYRLLTEADYYRQTEKAMAEELYKEFRKGE